MAKIVTIGRGGTGKTSFTALVAKRLIKLGESPILLVDTDPDQNLGEMVGVDLEKEGKRSITELLLATFIQGGGTTIGIPPSERIESRIWSEGLYEGRDFDFMAVGTKWTEGCYCLPDAALKRAIQNLSKTYRHILIDSPAGLENLNRRITGDVDDIFDLVDPSNKSFEHVTRAHRVIQEVKIEFKNFYLVGGYRFPEKLGDELSSRTGLRFVGKVPYDEIVASHVLEGDSLLDIPDASPAYKAVENIMSRVGYGGGVAKD
ncbi:AAA family ATPase [Candidatus Bathyarchaeota archaeon]|jgi:CO dehydrogenase maturation factor|nr:AAA family ATPase [Candidatus Bathyarchaeota archaeon]